MILLNHIEQWAEEQCKLIEELSKLKLTPGTPIHEFQQLAIQSMQRYRSKKQIQLTNAEFGRKCM